jgi:hypothetical protein
MQMLRQAGETYRDVPAPGDLRAEVMRQITTEPARVRHKSSVWSDLRNALRPLFAPQVAYGIAAGLVLGFAVGALSIWGHGKTPSTVLDFSGTVGLPQAVTPLVVDSGQFREDGLSVRWWADRYQNRVLLTIELHSNDDANVALDFDPAVIQTHALSQVGSRTHPLTVDNGAIQLNARGEFGFSVLFEIGDQNPTPIDLQVVTTDVDYHDSVTLEEIQQK